MRFRKLLILALVVSLVVILGAVAVRAITITYPAPVGEYAVGRTTITLEDPTREELFTEVSGDTRRLPVTIYYPIDPAARLEPSPYVEEWAASAFGTAIGLPQVVFGFVHSHSVIHAQPASTDVGFPVVIFSPGFSAILKMYTSLMEQIASYGYVIAAVDHPYSLGASMYPDGTSVTANSRGSDLLSDEGYRLVSETWTADLQFVLDSLEVLQTSDPLLAGVFDLNRVGAFGHSFGGAASTQAMIEDARILAAIDIDGSLMPVTLESELTRPFMMIVSEESDQSITGSATVTDEELAENGITRERFEQFVEAAERAEVLMMNTPPVSYRAVFADFRHNSFALDVVLWQPSFGLFIPEETFGSLNGAHALGVTTDYVVAFFDQYVRGDSTAMDDLIANEGDYPEVTVTVGGDGEF